MGDMTLDETYVQIYGLFDPSTGHLRYVGWTKKPLDVRLRWHIRDVKQGKTFLRRHKWLTLLRMQGLTPEIVSIETVPISRWQEAETLWIGYFRFIGCDLLNGTNGGDGTSGAVMPQNAKERLSRLARTRYSDPIQRERTGKAVREALATPEAKANMRKGRLSVPEASKKICLDALIAESKSPEGRERRRLAATGRTQTDAAKAKISAKNTGRKWSDDRRLAQTLRLTGRKHSAATKAKMSVAAQANAAASAKRLRQLWEDPQYRQEKSLANSETMKRVWAERRKVKEQS